MELHSTLEAMVARRREVMPQDPIQFVRRYDGAANRELVGLLAAFLAYGRVASILGGLETLLRPWGDDPAGAVRDGMHLDDDWARGFQYRWTTRSHLVALLDSIRDVWAEEGSLGQALATSVNEAGGVSETGLTAWTTRLREGAAARAGDSRALRFLISDPGGASAAKRLRLYLRWMIRPDDGVDLGLWSSLLPAADLVIPLDTHWARLAPRLGWTRRRTANAAMARDITGVLSRACPEDPLRYDFPICHFGIEGGCPTRLTWQDCVPCPLRPVCASGRRRVAAARRRGST